MIIKLIACNVYDKNNKKKIQIKRILPFGYYFKREISTLYFTLSIATYVDRYEFRRCNFFRGANVAQLEQEI